MRITIASDWWPPRLGGIETQIFDLACVLASRGHDVHVLTSMRQPTPAGVPGVQVEHVDLPMIGHITVPSPKRVSTIADRLERCAPDVVHAHGMFSAFAIGAVLAASRLRVPSVFTVHSLLRPLPVFTSARALFRIFLTRADVVTGVSAATVADIERASGREARLIPNGLALANWQPAPLAMPTVPTVRMLAVTRLAPKKRPLDLVRALAAAVRRHPTLEIVLEIVGEGPMRSAVEREARLPGVGDRVVFHGSCPRERVRELLRGASMFVQPGAREAFGLAMLEARASGVPIVAMASGGVTELVEHRRHGLLAHSHHELGECVAEMALNAGLRIRCAAEAARGLERYDWSVVAGQHEAAYATAIDRRQTSGRQVKNRIAATT